MMMMYDCVTQVLKSVVELMRQVIKIGITDAELKRAK